jgi:hypothetical protein
MHFVMFSGTDTPLMLFGKLNWPPSETVLRVETLVLMSDPGGRFSWSSALASFKRLILGAIDRLMVLA